MKLRYSVCICIFIDQPVLSNVMPVMGLISAGSLQDFVLECFLFCDLFLKLKECCQPYSNFIGEKERERELVDVIIFY